MIITEKFHTPNKYSRPQKKLEKVTKIVVHYVGNPGSSALANWNYFEGLKVGKTYTTKNGQKAYYYASAHYIVGLKGEILYCVPESEIAYTSNSANSYSIGIENCHPDWTGKFTDATYNALVELCANICKRYGLNPLTDIIRHFDVTKKDCPRYWVSNPNDFEVFKLKVKEHVTPEKSELEKALEILSTKKVGTDVLINTPGYWIEALKAGNVNPEYVKALLIKTSNYLKNL